MQDNLKEDFYEKKELRGRTVPVPFDHLRLIRLRFRRCIRNGHGCRSHRYFLSGYGCRGLREHE